MTSMIYKFVRAVKTTFNKITLPLLGVGSLIWFLVRVIPKPSRASYPCMKVAAPMASSFVLWILSLAASLFAFKKMKSSFARAHYLPAVLLLVTGLIATVVTLNTGSITSFANTNEGYDEEVTPNYPIGIAKGINAGRVVWIWNKNATNESCKNKFNGEEGTQADNTDDGWFLDKNNDQDEIDKMLSASLIELTGESNDLNAWEEIFKYFNENKHGRSEGYAAGEKIFIKINATSTWGKGFFWGNITDDFNHVRNGSYGMAETSPHIILSLLRQLVNVYSVPQSDISVGDPLKLLYNNSYDKWYAEFPDVHYIANEGGYGREAVVPTDSDVMKYSDKGNDMIDAVGDKIYTIMNNADYLINVPTMKAHARAGITLFAKNHFGSHTRINAEHLHNGLVAPDNANPIRTDSSMYRVQVDLMGHEQFGGNQVLFLLDALYSGSEATDPPTKWDMEPFNGDWTSSILVSQDPVAIESVAYDLLSTEYDGSYDIFFSQKVNYPHMTGTTDYLRQAASSDYWPEGIEYDPEGDGTTLGSLGVNEHWNNSTDMQYTRNLDTGEGIELIFIDQTVTDIDDGSEIARQFKLNQNYPNPFNPTTTINYELKENASVNLEIYDVTGALVKTLFSGTKSAGSHNVTWNGSDNKGNKAVSGNYIYRLTITDGINNFVQSKKMTLLK